jgi:hypothetical protein
VIVTVAQPVPPRFTRLLQQGSLLLSPMSSSTELWRSCWKAGVELLQRLLLVGKQAMTQIDRCKRVTCSVMISCVCDPDQLATCDQGRLTPGHQGNHGTQRVTQGVRKQDHWSGDLHLFLMEKEV